MKTNISQRAHHWLRQGIMYKKAKTPEQEAYQDYVFLLQKVGFQTIHLETLKELVAQGTNDPTIPEECERIENFIAENSFTQEELVTFFERYFVYKNNLDTIIRDMGKNPNFVRMFLRFENPKEYQKWVFCK